MSMFTKHDSIGEQLGTLYIRNDDTLRTPFGQPPVVVNYFFHEEIIPSGKRRARKS
jgi:hypothetical protein